VILPFARGGIVGSALLGLGRAMGETIAVVYLLGLSNAWPDRILGSGGTAIPALIADVFTQAPNQEQSALTLAGLALFAMTMVISLAARAVGAPSTGLPGSR
jgi:phosphate transport system permease protein